MNFGEFDQLFDRFAVSAFRLEALQRYALDESDEDYRAWRSGQPRPERSVRTNAWLARVARRTLEGASWDRVHVVDHPLPEYMRFELEAYRENAAAGERIMLADRAAHPDLHDLDTDFWLFDVSTRNEHAVIINYDNIGNVEGFTPTTDTETLRQLRQWRSTAVQHAVSLNVYLAAEATRTAA